MPAHMNDIEKKSRHRHYTNWLRSDKVSTQPRLGGRYATAGQQRKSTPETHVFFPNRFFFLRHSTILGTWTPPHAMYKLNVCVSMTRVKSFEPKAVETEWCRVPSFNGPRAHASHSSSSLFKPLIVKPSSSSSEYSSSSSSSCCCTS